jgi:hypothetical protein
MHDSKTKTPGTSKAGWRIPEWSTAVGVGRSHTYVLINAKKIDARKSGKATIITTSPEDYVNSLPAV